MKRLLCLFLVLAGLFGSALSVHAAGIGAGRGLFNRGAAVRVRAPGVRVNVGQRGILRGGLFSRGLFQRGSVVNVNVGQLPNGRLFRIPNRSAINVNVGHAVAVRSFASHSYAAAAVSYAVPVQAVYAQPVVVQQAPVIQQQVYAAPALASVYSAPVIQYAAPVYTVAAPVCAPVSYDVGYSSCGSAAVRVFVR